MQEARILVVDDEESIRQMVRFSLEREGFDVVEAEDAVQARVAVADEAPDLILMDWMMPGVSGLELTRSLRRDEMGREIPIIMLTARVEEGDRVRGLDQGADDYVTKPFSTRELVSRIRAVLRRSRPVEEEITEMGGIRLDAAGHRVTVGGRPVRLGPTEYRLLKFFMAHPDRVYTRAQLLDKVWGANVYIEERTVDVHIRRLRKALSEHDVERFVQTVRGAGYRFSLQE